MKFVLVSFLVLFVLFFSLSCNEGYDYSQAALGLDLQDYSCTEAWIEVQIGNNDKTANIYIKKNDEIIQTVNVGESETLFYFDGLLPNTTYKFDAVTYEDGKEVKSNPVTFKTLDTTSHNFTWQTFTFGQHSSSTLYDVAIIDENNIWAVGEIHMNDSLGNPDPNAYNAVHWNGNSWELKRIMFYTICGQQSRSSYPAKSIFTFNENEIWIAMDGDQIAKLENGIQVHTICLPWSFSINKMWGSSSSDLYVVGNNGNIAHYNGSQWTRLESGTNLDIYDIWGDFNDKKQEWEILCVASTLDINNGKEVLKISGTTVNKINNVGLPWSLRTVWFISERTYFIGGDGFYSARLLGETWIRDINMPPYYKTSIRGSGFNDIVITGAFGLIMHYNGISWYNYQDINYITGSYGNITLKRDLIVCTGELNNGKAILTIGKR